MVLSLMDALPYQHKEHYWGLPQCHGGQKGSPILMEVGDARQPPAAQPKLELLDLVLLEFLDLQESYSHLLAIWDTGLRKILQCSSEPCKFPVHSKGWSLIF